MATEPGFSPKDGFWRTFTRTHWGRKPTVIRAPFSQPIVTPAEVFRGVVATRKRLRELTDSVDLRIDGTRVVLELERWLPRAGDKSLEGYQARLKRAGTGGQLALLVNDFQEELGCAFYDRVRQFLRGLYELTGVPPRAEVDLFLGNYQRTPLGVHRDEAEVFCFVVEGKKRFRLWPREALRSSSARYGPGPYDRQLKHSFCLEGGPGDILFWPTSYWHVAESDGGLTSTLTLALYHGYSMFGALLTNISQWNREIGGDERDPIGSLPFTNPMVKGELAAMARRAEGQPGDLTTRLMRTWMERITRYGFDRIPRARAGAVRLQGRVRNSQTSPILRWRMNGRLVISANGRSMTVAADPRIERLLARVSRGTVCEVADLLEGTGRKSPRFPATELRRTLKFLLEEKALEAV